MVKFTDTVFGPEPKGLIYVLNMKPSTDPAELAAGTMKKEHFWYKTPSKLNSTRNRERGHHYGMVYCTSLLAEQTTHSTVNTVGTPIVWCDIDACKTLGVSGEAFFHELYSKEDATIWIRSSENGIQTIFKLDKMFEINGSKEVFEAGLSDLLWNVMWYFGGDWQTTNAQNLMRLPGSLNIKAQYKEPWEVQAYYPHETLNEAEPTSYTIKELRKRFPKDFDRVPKVVSFAIMDAISKTGAMDKESGIRHQFMLHLAGTLRRGLTKPASGKKRVGGINKESALNLFKEIAKFFQDDEVRGADLDTTYGRDEGEAMLTLWNLEDGEYKAAHQQIGEIVHFWVDLKKRYCKEMGVRFTGELMSQDFLEAAEDSPSEVSIAPPDPDGNFKTIIEDDYVATMYQKKGKDDSMTWEPFSNFVIIPKQKLVKSDTAETAWLVDVFMKGYPAKQIELGPSDLNDIKTFRAAYKNSGAALQSKNEWENYIGYLNMVCPKEVRIESTFYGVLNADNDERETTVLLPDRQHSTYVWPNTGKDTAEQGIYKREFSREQKVAYLTEFGKSYPLYHEPRYLYPALGWFCAAPISAMLRATVGGFPTMMVSGLPGLGKSQLIKRVLGPHFGSKTTNSFDTTTMFAVKQFLISNNLCPFVIDEFRDLEPTKVHAIQGLIRNLWDGSQTSSGRQDRSVVQERYVAPLCLIGEHHYSDEATIHRTFSIRIDRTWIDHVRTLSEKEKADLELRQQWLHASAHQGILGNLLLEWIEANLNEIPNVIAWARKLVDKTCPVNNERKRTGYIGVFAGLYLLSKVYAVHNVPFFLDKKTLTEAVYAADARIDDFKQNDTTTFRSLFQTTDLVITTANRNNRPLLGVVYVRDIGQDRQNIVYFEAVRWFQQIKEQLKGSTSATISDQFSFMELLKDAARNPDSAIVGFNTTHPMFRKNCVEVDLDKLSEKFEINTDQWLTLPTDDFSYEG